MVKVTNIVVSKHTVACDCLINGNPKNVRHVVLDKETLTPIDSAEQNPYTLRAAAMIRKYHNDTGAFPSEITCVWH